MRITAFGRVIYAEWFVVLLIAANLISGVGNLIFSASDLNILSGVIAVGNLVAVWFLFGCVGVKDK